MFGADFCIDIIGCWPLSIWTIIMCTSWIPSSTVELMRSANKLWIRMLFQITLFLNSSIGKFYNKISSNKSSLELCAWCYMSHPLAHSVPLKLTMGKAIIKCENHHNGESWWYMHKMFTYGHLLFLLIYHDIITNCV